MAPGASLASTILTPLATLHSGGVFDATATHVMPGSKPTGQVSVPNVADVASSTGSLTASLALVASSSVAPSPSQNASSSSNEIPMEIIEHGRMMQGIFNGECECDG